MKASEEIPAGFWYEKCWQEDCLPCPLPCNTLLSCCRRAVSGKKKRYEEEGFSLDLTYTSPPPYRIITHGFPSAGLEHLYRNPRAEIARFLDTKHPDHYKVFNLCCEPGRGYDPEVFHGRVERSPTYLSTFCPLIL